LPNAAEFAKKKNPKPNPNVENSAPLQRRKQRSTVR
jgi:hypothetical protein